MRKPDLDAAATALADNRLDTAEALLRAASHDDPIALRLLADLATRRERLTEAEPLLVRAVELAPHFDAARFDLARVLHRLARPEAARAQIAALSAKAARQPGPRHLHAAILARLGDYAAAGEIQAALLAEYPGDARAWLRHGHVLKTLGHSADATAAYTRAVTLQPTMGEAWYSLANMKTHRFGDADIAAMRAGLADPAVADNDRLHLDFALGKALEDRGDHASSFAHYAAGNARRRAQVDWDGAANRAHLEANRELFTKAFFAARERAGGGCPARDPIFIVGLPRSGSTLVEQILGSHAEVEGTAELPDITRLAHDLARKAGNGPFGYLGLLARTDPADLAAMGEAYLAGTRVQRKTDAPRFIDKMPNNFAYIALIHLILPNATIIDTRRGAMATCFSAWKQHYARGQAFTYDLAELGRFYTDYVALMDHFDRVLPGRILRVDHEALVTDPEPQIRRLLAHCGLGFDAACLAPHANPRAVRTPSSEQVRQPITTAGIDQWRHFEPWLGELKAALGPLAGK